MRGRKSLVFLLNLIFSAFICLVVKPRIVLYFRVITRANKRTPFTQAASPSRGEGGVSEMCAKCFGVCPSLMAGVKGESRVCRMGTDLFVQMVLWY